MVFKFLEKKSRYCSKNGHGNNTLFVLEIQGAIGWLKHWKAPSNSPDSVLRAKLNEQKRMVNPN